MARTKLDLTPYKADDKDYLDVEKFYGKKIKTVLGYLGGDGFMAFGVSRIVFEDGTDVFIEGSHDFAYLYTGTHGKVAEPPFDVANVEHGDYENGENEDDYYYDDWEGN